MVYHLVKLCFFCQYFKSFFYGSFFWYTCFCFAFLKKKKKKKKKKHTLIGYSINHLHPFDNTGKGNGLGISSGDAEVAIQPFTLEET